MKFITLLNPEQATESEAAAFRVRTAVRAVVYDQAGQVGILNVAKQRYHKLPGGGVEPGEDVYTALQRECLEELGCRVEIYGEIGQIIEYRKIFRLKQISPCYLARVVGEKGQPNFTSEESANDFIIRWLPVPEALRLLADDQPLSDEGRWYIVPRDRTFLALAAGLDQASHNQSNL
ncbi:MAG: NUDIX domain-containing protein [Patescibacteria group bacterium]